MIAIKTKKEVQIMREGGRLLAAILNVLSHEVKPGITTKYLDDLADKMVGDYKVTPSFKGYQGFPNTICVSINNEIVHGVPSSNKILKEGDIVSLDMGILYGEIHVDAALTLPVGKVSLEAQKIIEVTRLALNKGIDVARAANHLGDIGHAIQRYVESQGFGVVRELAGHGIGRDLHEEPLVLNYGKPRTGLLIKPGMAFALEPMVTEGDWHIKQGKDGFVFETMDGKLSAHFEHTIVITKREPEVLTKPID